LSDPEATAPARRRNRAAVRPAGRGRRAAALARRTAAAAESRPSDNVSRAPLGVFGAPPPNAAGRPCAPRRNDFSARVLVEQGVHPAWRRVAFHDRCICPAVLERLPPEAGDWCVPPPSPVRLRPVRCALLPARSRAPASLDRAGARALFSAGRLPPRVF